MTSENQDSTPITRRKPVKAFGSDAKRALMVKEEALKTLPRQTCFERGYIGVKDLDDEELRYGRCRDEYGYIPKNGKKTELLPRHMYDEMVAEHELRFKQKLRQNLDDMLQIMTDIAKDDSVEPRDRFEAAKYIFERTAGKTPDTVNVTVEHKPWEELLGQVTGIAAMSRNQHREIGAGIVDVDYEEIDDPNNNELDDHDNTPAATNLGRDEAGHESAYENRPGYRPPDPPDARAQVREYHVAHEPTRQPDYIDQIRDQEALAERRKAQKKKVQEAKKARAIKRATGADAIKDEITGTTIDPDGQVTFDM